MGNGWVEGFHGLTFGLVDGIVTMLGVVIGVAQATGDKKVLTMSPTKYDSPAPAIPNAKYVKP